VSTSASIRTSLAWSSVSQTAKASSATRSKAELQSIVEECQPEATLVIMADAAVPPVQRLDRFERGEPIEFNDYPTMWAITAPDLQAPWGETVNIDSTHG